MTESQPGDLDPGEPRPGAPDEDNPGHQTPDGADAAQVVPPREPLVPPPEPPVPLDASGSASTTPSPNGQRDIDDLEAIPVREDVPLDKRLEALLRTVFADRGSDLHLVAGAPPFVRRDGRLLAVPGWEPLRPDGIEAMVAGILTEAQFQRLRDELELNTAHSLPEARFRVNVHFQRGSMAAVFHLIPPELKTVDDLGLPPVVEEFARLRSGLVVVAGPNGSGKSTTLAALVDAVNTDREAHILTVEDPIEFLHRHKRSAVSQREVGPDTRGFARALEQALRQDPDVIMVGEMRDTDTIATAITAAEAGHLVFASLHTQDATQTVDRIIDVFPPHQQQQIRVQLSLTLQGIVAQQLVPAADGRGRLVACEILVATSAVRAVIREGKTDQLRAAILSGRKLGMQAMDASLAAMLHEGRITHDAAFDFAHSPDQLAKQLSSGYAGGLPTAIA